MSSSTDSLYPPPPDDSNGGVIAGAIIGHLVIFGIIVALCMHCVKRARKTIVQDLRTVLAPPLAHPHHTVHYEECQQRIIHYDIKPGNILLDEKFFPKVADFGLAKLCNRDNTHVSLIGYRGTPGYIAPEFYLRNHSITFKCDVYSFGMVLFEILGRRKNTNVVGSAESLDWFPGHVWERYEKSELAEVIEACGIEDEEDKVKAERMSLVALWCVQDSPEGRPPMSVIVKMLEGGVEIMPPPKPFHYLHSMKMNELKPSTSTSGSNFTSSEERSSQWYKETTPIMAKYEIQLASS